MNTYLRRLAGFLLLLSLVGTVSRVNAANPTVSTLPASGLSNTVATLNGSLNPGGQSTTAWFEWGGSPFTNANVTAPIVTNSGSSLTLNSPLSGLTPGLIYYSRLVASNATGIARSDAVPFGSPALSLIGNAVVTNGDFVSYLTAGARATFAPRAIGAGFNYGVVLRGDMTPVCWMAQGFNNNYHGFGPGVSNLVAISANVNYALGLKNDGTVVAETNSIFANIPSSASNVVAIAAGGLFGLALRSNHTVVGWGTGVANYTAPADLTNATAIAAGSDFSLALRSDGTIVAWGNGSNNQTNVPPGLSNVVAIAAGGSHSLALKSDGTVVGWGSNFAGEGIVPGGLSNVVAVAAGVVQSLALKSDGTVVAWGETNYNPGAVAAGLSNVVAIATSDYNNLVLREDGSAFVWSFASTRLTNVPPSVYEFPWFVSGNLNTNIPGTYQLTYTSATNIFGGVAAPVTLTVVVLAAPVLDQVSPSHGPPAGGITLTLTGSDFGTSGIVQIGGKNANILTNGWSPTQIQCTLPPGEGTNLSVVVTVNGRPSAAKSFSYDPPLLMNLSPTNGPTAGGTPIVLSGLNFGGSGYVTLGSTVISNFTSWTDNSISFMLPAGFGGNLKVTVNVGGQANASGPKFSYFAPVIASLTPTNGPTAGGIPLTLLGTDFGQLGSGFVTLGNSGLMLFVNTWSPTNIQCQLPPGQGSNIPISVVVAGQASVPKQFSYLPPQILSVSPAHGPTAGLTNITLTGTNFGGSGTVTIGTFTPPNYAGWSHTQISFTLPQGQGSNLPVVVNVSNQFSSPAWFSYDAPKINDASPSTGPTAGGTPITINGSNFGNGGAVAVGNFAATNFLLWSDSKIVFYLPAGEGSNLPVVVNIAGQPALPARFSYFPPSLQGVTPGHGPTAGGTLVTLDGLNFGLNPIVYVGEKFAQVKTNSHSQIVCEIPPGGGTNQTVSVNAAGQISNPQSFSYDPPLITGLSPTNGPTAGGTLISITGTNFGITGNVIIGGFQATFTDPSATWGDGIIRCLTPPGTGFPAEVRVITSAQISGANSFYYTRPWLMISNLNGAIELLWPANATDYVLEQSGVLSSNWGPFMHLVVTTNGSFTTTVPIAETNAWFRLRRP